MNNFDIEDFTPYLLNRAAEQASLRFQAQYRDTYGMLRTEWRVLFHLGRFGEMTARSICDRAGTHKTKVSRAVAALERKRFLKRIPDDQDKRCETLQLTRAGKTTFYKLLAEAQRHDAALLASYSQDERALLRRFLLRVAEISRA